MTSYLAFQLGRGTFGIPASEIREVIRVQEIAASFPMAGRVSGRFELRGRAIPFVDLRVKFGLPAMEYPEGACIMVAHAPREIDSALMGIVVDGVGDMSHPGVSQVELLLNRIEEIFTSGELHDLSRHCSRLPICSGNDDTFLAATEPIRSSEERIPS